MGVRLSDLFIPRHMHKNPDIRKEGASMLKDTAVLAKMAEIDIDEGVRKAAAKRLSELKDMKGIS
jgi:hypothetical protein